MNESDDCDFLTYLARQRETEHRWNIQYGLYSNVLHFTMLISSALVTLLLLFDTPTKAIAVVSFIGTLAACVSKAFRPDARSQWHHEREATYESARLRIPYANEASTEVAQRLADWTGGPRPFPAIETPELKQKDLSADK